MTISTPFDGNSISAKTREYLDREHKLWIDGEWVSGVSVMESLDPATDLPLAKFHIGGAEQIDHAVAAAKNAFDGPWRKMSAAQRMQILLRLSALIRDNATLLAEIDVIDNGMPRMIADLCVMNGAEMFEYYAGAVMRIEGVTTPPPRHITDESEALTYTVQEPIGVVGMIIPWNVPLSMAILKAAPALAAGCTMVIKPSELTPLSALAFAELTHEAGIPKGVVNVVNGLGTDAGHALAQHPQVDKISFTGSTATGRAIVSAALSNLKKVALELGGKSPVVVMPDVDLELAIPGVALATNFLQGQNCMAGTRIFVHADILDELVEGVRQFLSSMKLGHGLDRKTFQGPIISSKQADKILSYIEGAKREGAIVAAGGERLDRAGNFIKPTILLNCQPDMTCVREEIFGPVMAIQQFDTMDLDTIAAMANDTSYGLSGSVWTKDLSTAHRLVSRIRAGHVSINCHGAVGTNIPFGGFGQSGWGREFGKAGIDSYLETKAVTARL